MDGEYAFPTVAAPTEQDVFQVLRNTRNARFPTPQRFEEDEEPKSQEPPRRKVRPGSYEALGLCKPVCLALQSAGYSFPTPIQRRVIPIMLAGHDVVAMARTGSGKTAAFLAPLLHRLSDSAPTMAVSSRRNGPRALIVAPTRELVLQSLKFCRLYSKRLERGVRAAVVVGGVPLEAQFEALAVCPEILFATPGRLLQIQAEMGAKSGLTLATAETVVFDEADRLFEGTLAVETAALIDHLKDRQTEGLQGRQTVLVSATMPYALAEFSRSGLRRSLSVVRLDADRGMSPTIAVAFLSTREGVEKDAVLQLLLRRVVDEQRSAVVFAATHRTVEYLSDLLRGTGVLAVGCVHGQMDQLARQETVGKFRKGVLKVMVVTDVAARGIDLPDLDVVINYDAPATPKLFVHRVGRVARAGRFGLAFNLVTADELPYMVDVFLYVGRHIVLAEPRRPNDEGKNPFSAHAFSMDTSFIFGSVPRDMVEEEIEAVQTAVEELDLTSMQASAHRSHGMYRKTRGKASGESARRAKNLLAGEEGTRKALHVHPWFYKVDTSSSGFTKEQASLLSAWRPKECLVKAPSSIIRRKSASRKNQEEDLVKSDDVSSSPEEAVHMDISEPNKAPALSESKEPQVSARQLALQEEKRNFFLPSKQDAAMARAQQALKVKSGGSMADDLSAYRELRDAAMDVGADGNTDMLRASHTSGNSAKYWDRVQKKFVKGGVTAATSRRNVHVASREAKARARAGESYGTEDGELFKKWLSKNRKAVEQLAEQVGEGGAEGGVGIKSEFGLANNDFRKGAFGRRARVAAAARNKDAMKNGAQMKGVRSELKTAAQIRKARKETAKARARSAKKSTRTPLPAKWNGSGKTRVIVRHKK